MPVVCVQAFAGLAFSPHSTGVSPLQHWENAAWLGQTQNVVEPLMSKQQVKLLVLLLHPSAKIATTKARRPIRIPSRFARKVEHREPQSPVKVVSGHKTTDKRGGNGEALGLPTSVLSSGLGVLGALMAAVTQPLTPKRRRNEPPELSLDYQSCRQDAGLGNRNQASSRHPLACAAPPDVRNQCTSSRLGP